MTPVCDILLLTWNRRDLLEPCVEHVLRHTQVPSRLLIIDNGSTEPALAAYLAQVQGTAHVQVAVRRLDPNRGFAGGMNAGLQASTAPWICLLSNDVLVGPGWLAAMIEAAEAQADVGLINPRTAPPEAFAFPGGPALLEVGMCIGFCVLMPRRVLEAVGLFDEAVGAGYFEDEDLSMRVREKGWRCVVARRAAAYHAEHQTFGRGAQTQTLFARNRAWCEGRWGRWVRIAWPQFAPLQPGSDTLRQLLAQVRSWLRRRVLIDLVAPGAADLTAEALFASVGLMPHADVRWRRVPAPAAPWGAALRILARRKKRYDMIIAPDPAWAAGMRRCAPWHGALVVEADATEALERAWQTKSRSPS